MPAMNVPSSAPARLFAWPFQSFLPALRAFNYNPWTNWAGMFQNWFSPHITFGNNIQDQPVEDHVLLSVGSYGKQLNCIIDAMSVLVTTLDRRALTRDEQSALLLFEDLARQADIASADYQGKPRRQETQLSTAAVDGWIDALRTLKRDNAAAYARLAQHLKDNLPPAADAAG